LNAKLLREVLEALKFGQEAMQDALGAIPTRQKQLYPDAVHHYFNRIEDVRLLSIEVEKAIVQNDQRVPDAWRITCPIECRDYIGGPTRIEPLVILERNGETAKKLGVRFKGSLVEALHLETPESVTPDNS
jgi:hypothetical protein